MSLPNRIARSRAFGMAAALPLSLWARFCHATTRWSGTGRAALLEQLQQGPVVMLVWHADLAMTLVLWPRRSAPAVTLRDPSPAGNVSSCFQRWFGITAHEIKARKMTAAALRPVMKAVAGGATLGLTADGPKGPALAVKPAPVDWIRIVQRPVWLHANVQRRGWRANSWDRMQIPRPFTSGVSLYRKWDGTVPRDATEADREAARLSLQTALLELRAEAERLAG